MFVFAAKLAREKFFGWFFGGIAMAPSFRPAPGGCAAGGCFIEELRVFCMGEEL